MCLRLEEGDLAELGPDRGMGKLIPRWGVCASSSDGFGRIGPGNVKARFELGTSPGSRAGLCNAAAGVRSALLPIASTTGLVERVFGLLVLVTSVDGPVLLKEPMLEMLTGLIWG